MRVIMQSTTPLRIKRLPRTPHPLGPLVARRAMEHPVKSRVIALVVLVVLATPLTLVAFLTPDPSGTGTHRQLGYPTCLIHALTGYPCPTCGMTTAMAHAVRGQWARAFHAQPMGWLVALAAMIGIAATLATLLSGKGWSINWYRLSPARTIVVALFLFAAAWGYKIMATVMRQA